MGVLITLKNDFGKSLAAGFKEAAGQFNLQIVNEYEYSIKDRQFGPIVAKVKADVPEAIYATGYFLTAGPLVSQLRAAGITVPVIGQEGYDSEQFIKIAGKAPKVLSLLLLLTVIQIHPKPDHLSANLRRWQVIRLIWWQHPDTQQ